MVSLLRRNHSEKKSKKQRPLTRSLISDQLRPSDSYDSKNEHERELYNDSSLDSFIFAASLGLMSKTQQTTKNMMLVMHEQPKELNPKNSLLQKKSQQKLQQKNQDQHNQVLEFQCRFCGKGYRWKSTMRRHETLECGDKPPSFQCPECPYKARQRGNLTVHIKRHHHKN